MSLRDQLQAIRERHGKLTPAIVVDEARDAEHPLHDRFEWDNTIAGEAWRRAQAHELIRSVRVVYKKADERAPEKSVRAFHAVRLEEEYVYETAEAVVEDEFLVRLVLADMEREWTALKRRYDDFEEFWTLVKKDLPKAA